MDGPTVSWVLSSTLVVNESYSMTQHGVASADRTHDLSIRNLMHCDPIPQIYTSLWIQHDEAIGFFFRHLIACGNGTAKSISEFSITSSGRRFVEFNLLHVHLSHMTLAGSIRYSVEYEQYSNVHVQNHVEIVNNCQ